MITSRERLLNVMQGSMADRTAVAPFVYGNVVREWKGDVNADLISGTIEFCKTYGFDIILRNFNIRADTFSASSSQWQIETTSIEKDSITTEITTKIETPSGRLVTKRTNTRLNCFHTVTACTESLIKTEEDFRMLARYCPPSSAPLYELKRAKKVIGQDGILAPWTAGVFNYMAQLRALDDLLTDPYLNPDFYAEFAEYALLCLKNELAPILCEGVDMLSYAGNIANSSLVGPAFFEQFVLPYEKQLVDYIQQRCVGIIYHNCGDGSSMIPCYNALAPRCYESMTEPPYADNSLTDCATGFSQNITLMGGIDQITFLRKATPEQIIKRASDVLRIFSEHQHFILGTSDFLEQKTPKKNLSALSSVINLLNSGAIK